MRVMVADDSVLLREGVTRLLENAGHEVVAQAADRDELMRKARAHRPDVAIIDISLRGAEDGFALAELASEKGCGIILATGDPVQRVRLEASGRRHILKPFRMLDLTALVDQVLKDAEALCVPRRPPDGSVEPAIA